MEALFIVIYGVAFALIIYYMIQLKPLYMMKSNSIEEATTANAEYPRDMHANLVWPWSITTYSFWPQWMDEHYKENLKKSEYKGNQHGGGYGYTGRQNAKEMKSFEGDHYGWDLEGGNYCGGGTRPL